LASREIDFNKKVVEMKGITKKFGDFTANEKIDLTVHKGEIHSLLGENGAGKTTLMNILYGLYHQTEGEILINGKHLDIKDPNVAIANGIGMVHQHFMLVPKFTVTENIILGSEPVKGANRIDMEVARKKVVEISEKYGLKVDPEAKIQDISVGMQQRVEILKALFRGAEILILDEPTAVLTPQEIDELINIMKSLTKQGKSIIIITHKLKEIKACADFCTIIRRGKKIDVVDVDTVTEEDLASMMVGREVNFEVDKDPKEAGEVVLEIKDLVVEDSRGLEAVEGLNLKIRKGEILGLAGVDGNGQSELIEAITGLRPIKSGEVILHDANVANLTPREIIEKGISNIPEDRQKHGLVLDFPIFENMVLQNYNKEPFAKGNRLQFDKIREFAEGLVEKFDVRPTDIDIKARALSGGNQQKAILGREITAGRRLTGDVAPLLVAVYPTRGLDVGAIEAVRTSLLEQRAAGTAVLLISEDLEELITMSDRIVVMHGGEFMGIVEPSEVDIEQIGLMMAGERRQ